MTPAALKNQALTFVQNNRPAEAERSYRQALALAPDDHEAHFGLANLLRNLGRYQEAIASYEQTIRYQPEHAGAWNNQGVVFVTLERYDNAISSYRQALALKPDYAMAWNNLGNALAGLKRWAEAEQSFKRALTLKTDYAQAHYNLANALVEQARWKDAEGAYRLAIKYQADYASAYNNLGSLLINQQRADEAIPALRQALRFNPRHAGAHNNLGLALFRKGDAEKAIEHIQSALLLQPGFVDAYINLGNIRSEQLRYDEAIVAYEAALRIQPAKAEAHCSLGNVLAGLGQDREAERHYREALRLKPDYPEALSNLGILLDTANKMDEAADCHRRALALNPELANVHTLLGNTLARQGKIDAAGESYRRALALAPSDGTKIKLAIMLPPILRSHEHIDEVRTGLEKNLEALAASPLRLIEPDKEIGNANFFLAYHGLNNRDLQTKLARLYEAACPELLWTAPHCLERKPRRGPIKIGFISKFMHNHSIGKTTSGLLAELSREQFEVHALFIPPLVDDELSRFIRTKADETHVLPLSLEAARQKISELELDILFYQDIGMDPFTYFLAFARLAPVQCVTFGHPDTTGIGNMDYWISNDLFEPEDAQAHYNEQLFLLHDLGTLAYYYRPKLPNPAKTRADFNLPGDATLYLCPQTLFKFHPDFDVILAGILRADPRGRIVLIAAKIPHWVELLRQRFAQTFPDVLDRVMFVPQQNSRDFIGLLAVADVILDTPHFNGMNTSLEAFAVGTPVVTWPRALQRGRHTYGMYRKMGMDECIAQSAEEYIALAVRLGTDHAFRADVSAKVLARNGALYEDKRAVSEFERFFTEAFSRLSTNDISMSNMNTRTHAPAGEADKDATSAPGLITSKITPAGKTLAVESMAIIATRDAWDDLDILLHSLYIFHPLTPIYLLADDFTVAQVRKHFPYMNIHSKANLNLYSLKNRKIMENEHIFLDFLLHKMDAIDLALENHSNVLFLDSDILFLAPFSLDLIKDHPDIFANTSENIIGLSPHLIRSNNEQKYGRYNAGFIFVNDYGFTKWWRDATKSSRFFEQACLDDCTEHFRVTEIDSTSNYGWWRLFECDRADVQKRIALFKLNDEHGYIEYDGKRLQSIHTHFNERGLKSTVLFNCFILNMMDCSTDVQTRNIFQKISMSLRLLKGTKDTHRF